MKNPRGKEPGSGDDSKKEELVVCHDCHQMIHGF
ncbi:MAG: hypothetical protein ACLRJV_14360 [Eubacteriales bacterium]